MSELSIEQFESDLDNQFCNECNEKIDTGDGYVHRIECPLGGNEELHQTVKVKLRRREAI